ncbi:hypothetical protein C2845_PM13G18130 [Panicum miliaceum]|uniref:Uncharacterized protein n=1 Tax=Panicum miliaceum TaxID=4540 RepID=A0A3L6RNM5_PANMI|nr:hypothetical protein C2845_PM13G18130 [Panicum miliaceum]
MAAGPGPTSRATEASYVELAGCGVKVGRFHANSEQKPFAQAELQSPPSCICSFRAPSCSFLLPIAGAINLAWMTSSLCSIKWA